MNTLQDWMTTLTEAASSEQLPIIDISDDIPLIEHVRDYHQFVVSDLSAQSNLAVRGYHVYLHQNNDITDHAHPEAQLVIPEYGETPKGETNGERPRSVDGKRER